MWFTFLFRRQTWRNLWIAVRRFHRDRRAREFLGRFLRLGALTVYFGILAILFVQHVLFADKTKLAVALIVLVCAVSVFAVHKWNDRRDARAIQPFVAESLVREMHKEAFLLATLLRRAASERMTEKELPPEVEVITRRVQREQLIEYGFWDELPGAMRDLLLLPDGHWTAEQKWNVESCWEYFAVLRWVLRLDDALRPLDRSYDFDKAKDLIEGFRSRKLGDALAPWDLRPVRTAAENQLGRVWTEAVARGILVHRTDPNDREEALRIKAGIDRNGASTDMLVGAKTVSELSDANLFYLVQAAYRRWGMLDLLVSWLSRTEPDEAIRQYWSQVIQD